MMESWRELVKQNWLSPGASTKNEFRLGWDSYFTNPDEPIADHAPYAVRLGFARAKVCGKPSGVVRERLRRLRAKLLKQREDDLQRFARQIEEIGG